MALNRVAIMGRLTRDPELRYTPSGVPVAAFTLAIERDYKPQGGERETDFIDLVVWRHTAEFVCKYFAKGRMMAVDGRLQARTYQDKEGKNRKAVEVVADNVYFGDSKKEDAGDSYPPVHYSEHEPQQQFTELDDDDGELPF